MNREDIIKLAREAGWPHAWMDAERLERFAALIASRVAAAAKEEEREANIKAADDQWVKDPRISGGEAIRARGETSSRGQA